LFILTRCFDGSEDEKESYIKEIFFGFDDRVQFVTVAFDNNESKGSKWDSMGFDFDIYIDDEIYNIMEMIKVPIKDTHATKKRVFMMPMFGYNYIPPTEISKIIHNKNFLVWYDRALNVYNTNRYKGDDLCESKDSGNVQVNEDKGE
jgi:hypothetical protein